MSDLENMEKKSGLDYDQILLKEVGQCGPWQKRLFLLLCLPSALSSMAVFMFEMIAFTPSHRCFVPGCDDLLLPTFQADHVAYSLPESEEGGPSPCYQRLERGDNMTCQRKDFLASQTKSVLCDRWVFSHDIFQSTATEDLNMVCERAWMKSAAQTVYMAGMLVGSFVFGWLGDKFGRKPTLMTSLILLAIGGTLPALFSITPNLYFLFTTSRFISGLGHVGTFLVTISLALEYVGATYRASFGILIEIPFALGGVTVGLLSWAGVRAWQDLMLLASLPNLLLVSYWFFLPESPRWLLHKGDLDQFHTVVAEAVRVNRSSVKRNTMCDTKHTGPDLLNDLQVGEAQGNLVVEAQGNLVQSSTSQGILVQPSLLDMFRPHTILLRSLSLSVNWLVTILCYFCLTSTASVLTDDIYLNFTLVGLAEVPACLICVVCMDRWGRRPVTGSCQILAGLACVLAGVLQDSPLDFLQVPLSLLGKFGSSGSMALLFVYTAELYPTSVRNTAIGLCSTWGRVGGMLAPQVYLLSQIWTPLPMLVMGGSSLLGGLLIFLLLPETKGHRLPDTMEEAIRIGEKPDESHPATNKLLPED